MENGKLDIDRKRHSQGTTNRFNHFFSARLCFVSRVITENRSIRFSRDRVIHNIENLQCFEYATRCPSLVSSHRPRQAVRRWSRESVRVAGDLKLAPKTTRTCAPEPWEATTTHATRHIDSMGSTLWPHDFLGKQGNLPLSARVNIYGANTGALNQSQRRGAILEKLLIERA